MWCSVVWCGKSFGGCLKGRQLPPQKPFHPTNYGQQMIAMKTTRTPPTEYKGVKYSEVKYSEVDWSDVWKNLHDSKSTRFSSFEKLDFLWWYWSWFAIIVCKIKHFEYVLHYPPNIDSNLLLQNFHSNDDAFFNIIQIHIVHIVHIVFIMRNSSRMIMMRGEITYQTKMNTGMNMSAVIRI